MGKDCVFCEEESVALNVEAQSRHSHWLSHALRWSVAGLSSRIPGFDSEAVHVRHMVDKVALERQASLPVIWFPCHSTILSHILLLPEEQTGKTWEP